MPPAARMPRHPTRGAMRAAVSFLASWYFFGLHHHMHCICMAIAPVQVPPACICTCALFSCGGFVVSEFGVALCARRTASEPALPVPFSHVRSSGAAVAYMRIPASHWSSHCRSAHPRLRSRQPPSPLRPPGQEGYKKQQQKRNLTATTNAQNFALSWT